MTLLALEPWEPGPETVLRSAVGHRLREAGARFERRGGWEVAAAVPGEEERLGTAAFTDASHLGKLEQRGGSAPAESAERAVIEISPGRWIVLCEWSSRAATAAELEAAGPRMVLDLSGAWTILLLGGPRADRLLRRLGPVVAVPGAGQIAGVPGRVTRRGELLLVLTPSEYGQHVWDFCADLCLPLGGGPVGFDALAGPSGDALLVGA